MTFEPGDCSTHERLLHQKALSVEVGLVLFSAKKMNLINQKKIGRVTTLNEVKHSFMSAFILEISYFTGI